MGQLVLVYNTRTRITSMSSVPRVFFLCSTGWHYLSSIRFMISSSFLKQSYISYGVFAVFFVLVFHFVTFGIASAIIRHHLTANWMWCNDYKEWFLDVLVVLGMVFLYFGCQEWETMQSVSWIILLVEVVNFRNNLFCYMIIFSRDENWFFNWKYRLEIQT